VKIKPLDYYTVVSLAHRIYGGCLEGDEPCIRMYTKKGKLLCTLTGGYTHKIGASPDDIIRGLFEGVWDGENVNTGKMKYGVFELLSDYEGGEGRVDGEFFAFPVAEWSGNHETDFTICGGVRMMSRECRKGDKLSLNSHLRGQQNGQ
jgi:hypothetical protein